MGCINRVEISGNLTRSPEIRATKGGRYLAELSVAVNSGRGENQRTSFVDCVKFMGESPSGEMQRFWSGLEKGRRVFVAGHLQQERWEQDGRQRSRLKVIVDELDTVGRPDVDPASYAPGQQMPLAATPPEVPREATADVYDEDIPF